MYTKTIQKLHTSINIFKKIYIKVMIRQQHTVHVLLSVMHFQDKKCHFVDQKSHMD